MKTPVLPLRFTARSFKPNVYASGWKNWTFRMLA